MKVNDKFSDNAIRWVDENLRFMPITGVAGLAVLKCEIELTIAISFLIYGNKGI